MNIGVILAGGLSSRFGTDVHQQYLKLNGKEMIYYTLSRMRECPLIDDVILVVDKKEYDSHYIENKYSIKTICGGNSRNESVFNALEYIKENFDCEKVLFHDVTRPLIKTDYYTACLENLTSGYDAVISYQEITDSLYSQEEGFVNRDSFKLIQTPEVFWFKKICKVFDKEKKNTTIVSQLEKPNIYFIKSDKFGFKVTYPNDLFLAEQLDKINYYELSKHEKCDYDFNNKKLLVFGGSGGLGSAFIEYVKTNYSSIEIKAPRSYELNLKNITVKDIQDYCDGFKPDIILNAAAISLNDDDGIVETFDDVFGINLKSNLVIIEYAKTLNKAMDILLISSSSSTKGRQNITNYSASKAALNSVVESLAEPLHKFNIDLNAVIPEKINTPMIQKLHKTNISNRELLETQEVIDAMVKTIASKNYGQLIHIRKGL